MSNYQRISCEDHSVYELAIMRAQSIKVLIDNKEQTLRPKDIVAREGAEFLLYIDELGNDQEIRADHVVIKA